MSMWLIRTLKVGDEGGDVGVGGDVGGPLPVLVDGVPVGAGAEEEEHEAGLSRVGGVVEGRVPVRGGGQVHAGTRPE